VNRHVDIFEGGGKESIFKLSVVMVAQLCEYSKSH
jgi:hypothetical protein